MRQAGTLYTVGSTSGGGGGAAELAIAGVQYLQQGSAPITVDETYHLIPGVNPLAEFLGSAWTLSPGPGNYGRLTYVGVARRVLVNWSVSLGLLTADLTLAFSGAISRNNEHLTFPINFLQGLGSFGPGSVLQGTWLNVHRLIAIASGDFLDFVISGTPTRPGATAAVSLGSVSIIPG